MIQTIFLFPFRGLIGALYIMVLVKNNKPLFQREGPSSTSPPPTLTTIIPYTQIGGQQKTKYVLTVWNLNGYQKKSSSNYPHFFYTPAKHKQYLHIC